MQASATPEGQLIIQLEPDEITSIERAIERAVMIFRAIQLGHKPLVHLKADGTEEEMADQLGALLEAIGEFRKNVEF
jgi:hypothetical protein